MTASTTKQEQEKAIEAELVEGMYFTTDRNGRELMFGWDEDVSGIYGWAAPFGDDCPSIAKFADDEEDAPAIAAERIVAWLDAIPAPVPVRSGEARQPVLPISADELRTLGSITTDVRPRLLALASALDALATAVVPVEQVVEDTERRAVRHQVTEYVVPWVHLRPLLNAISSLLSTRETSNAK